MLKNPFTQDLDNVWPTLGYASKRNAKRRLIESFSPGIDFVMLPSEKRSKHGRRIKYERIVLTLDCFYKLRRLAPAGNEMNRQLGEVGKRSRQQARQHLAATNIF